MRRSSPRLVFALLLFAGFVFRLGFGLSKELFSDDETQIYLLGLRFHATHQWPYFGPDVVWTQSEIPGALQALLVGLPLDVVPIPEAPYVFLNVLSMGALCLFAAYLSARLPTVPRWLIWAWLLTIPWTLEYSTHILNTSYVLPASIVFFIAFFEAWPVLSIGRVPVNVAHLMMGAALGWMFQIHMSWPLLLPFAGVAFLYRMRDGARAFAGATAAFALGLLLTISLALPTFIASAELSGAGDTGQNLLLHWRNPLTTGLNTMARIFSFASFEVGRFIASAADGSPIVFLAERWWLVPVAGFVWIVGIIHPLFMAVTAFRRSAQREWPAVRWMTIATVVLVSASFFLVMQPAQARSFYVVAPVGFLFAAYCWTFIDSPRWRRVAVVVLVANVMFQSALAIQRLSGPSLYMKRAVVAEAIRVRQPGLLAYRRPWARNVPAEDRMSADASAKAVVDLKVTDAQLQLVRGLATWSIVVHNQSATTAYRSMVCLTRYYDAADKLVDERINEVWLVLEPGESVRDRVIDAVRWTPDMARGEVVIRSADAIAPMPPSQPTGRQP